MAYDVSDNYWKRILKNYQELVAYANLNLAFTEYVLLPLFVIKEYEKNLLEIKDLKNKAISKIGN